MQTTIISSHGLNCPATKPAPYLDYGEVFKLPSNVIVLMNCYDSPMFSYTKYDSKLWAFATNNKLHMAMKKEKMTVNNLAKYFQALQGLNDNKNKLCVFADKCPNIFFAFEEKKFRSGVFKLPTKITVKDKFKEDPNVIIHTKTFESLGEGEETDNPVQNRLALAWLQTSKDRSGYLESQEKFSVKPHSFFPAENNDSNKLSSMVKSISEENPNKMNVVIAWACRGGKKVNMKLQQYSASDNPFQTAIVFYDKIVKMSQAKALNDSSARKNKRT